MRQRTSYLDTVNAGRVRRASSDLEAISSTLTGLEAELDRLALNRPTKTMPNPPRPTFSPRESNSISADIAANASLVERVVREIENLKSEVRSAKQPSALDREVADLKNQLAGLQHAVERSAARGDLTGEFARLHHRLEAIPSDSGASQMAMLRDEMDELKHAISLLARDESVRAVEQRWQQFDNRFAHFQNDVFERLDRPQSHNELLELADRIYNLQELVASLPETLPIGTLEKQIGTLAKAIERVATNTAGADTAGALAAVEERLDELSRAVVASSVSSQPPLNYDFSSIDRIEAKIATIAKYLDEATNAGSQQEMLHRIDMLGRKVDQALEADLDSDSLLRAFDDRLQALHRRMEDLSMSASDAAAPRHDMHAEIVSRLNEIESKLEHRKAPAIDEGALVRQLESRLHAISLQIEETRPEASSDEAFRSLEARIADIAARLDASGAEIKVSSPPPAYFSQIEDRIQDIVDRLDRPQPRVQHDDAAFQMLERRLADITARLDSAVVNPHGAELPALANLESQMADISRHLGSIGGSNAGFDIEPRLASIEKSIAANRETVFEAARAAAENALANFRGNSGAAVPLALSEDLKALESLARKTDERNSKTFSAIHDTLLKIVDRIGQLESAPATSSMHAPSGIAAPLNRPKIADRQVPSLDPAHDEPLPPLGGASPDASARRPAPKSPASAAVAAAKAAMAEGAGRGAARPPKASESKSLVGGIARVLSRKSAEPVAEKPLPGTELPKATFEAPIIPAIEPEAEDKPIDPGNGMPDLNAIMKRVREERAGGGRPLPEETGKQDFLAAARRAAQAAAAEAEVLSRADAKRKKEGAGKFDAKDLIAKRRKPLAIAACAVLLAIASWQLSQTFFTDGPGKPATPATASNPVEPAAVPAAKDEPLDASSKTGAVDSEAAKTGFEAAPKADEKPVRVVGSNAAPEAEDVQTLRPAGDASAKTAMNAARTLQPATAMNPAPGKDEKGEAKPQEAPPAAKTAKIEVPTDSGPVALREAAGSGNALALFEIASRYAEGRNGGKQDLKTAYNWYKQSAEAGFAPAQYRIGSMLEKGMGAERDIKQAKTWYQMAAAQGNASAMHNLAVLFAMGADGAPDNDSAVEWFQKAAELGVKDSQYNLGILAANGQGIEQNLEESYKWFALAAKAGDKEAAKRRDEVFKVLRPEQQQKARATAELWKPKALDDKANSVEIPEEWREGKEQTASVDIKKAIRNVQGILNKNGFDAGVADGVMGLKTVNAIKAFQKANGLPATGEIDQPLVKALLAKN